jgi:hypothetical protein
MHQRSDNTLLARSSLRRNIVVCKKLLMTRTLFRTESAYHVATSTLPTMTDHKPLFRRTPLTLRSLFLLEHIPQSLIAWENVQPGTTEPAVLLAQPALSPVPALPAHQR